MGPMNEQKVNIFRFPLPYNRSINKAMLTSGNKSQPGSQCQSAHYRLNSISIMRKLKSAEGTHLCFSFRDIVDTRCSQEEITFFPGLLAIIFQPKDSLNFWYRYRTSTKTLLK